MRQFTVICALLGCICSLRADIIAQWNFNSPAPDALSTTGSLEPSTGAGWLSTCGDVTTSFSTGDTRDAATDNTAVATAHFPAATNANLTAGLRFDVSTVDYEQITVGWSQRNSATASKFLRLQYTVDGSTFVDSAVLTMAADSLFTNLTINLSAIPAANNNPSFGFRLLTEWQHSASGTGPEAYLPTTSGSTYGSAGTIRFDLVTVSGVLRAGGNHPPTISIIPAQSVRIGHATAPVEFTILDAEDPASELTLTAESSDPTIIPAANLTFGGSSSSRNLMVKSGTQTGSSLITVRVTDRGAKSTATTFSVTVLPQNSPPSISTVPTQYVLAGTPSAAIPFTVGDMETAPGALSVSAYSPNSGLLPPGGITLGGLNADRFLSINPAYGQWGLAPVILRVGDGLDASESSFPVMVLPARSVLLADSFSYGDGPVTTNSARFWYNRSGTDGEMQVKDGCLHVVSTQTEDVAALLLNGPYTPGTQAVLYASFLLNLPALPQKAGGYFAHFGSGSTLCARLYASTTNAAPGFFRLLISSGTGWPVAHPDTFQTNHFFRVVISYSVDTGASMLWVNPRFEQDRVGISTDVVTPGKVSFFGFRQSTDIGGEYVVDDVRVGLSFAAVTSEFPPVRPAMSWMKSGAGLQLSWPSGAGILQSAPRPEGPFTNIPSGTATPFQCPATGSARFFRLLIQ